MRIPPGLRSRLTRDWTTRAFAMLGIGYETVVHHVDRPTLLIGFFGLLGLPTILKTDEKREATPAKDDET